MTQTLKEGRGNEVSSKVKAICAIYPPAQIRKYDNSDPIIDAYKALMGKDAEQVDYDKASPLLQIQKDFPPTMLIHGSTDSVVDLSDSTDIYRKLVDLGFPLSFIFTQKKNMLLIHKVDMEDL